MVMWYSVGGDTPDPAVVFQLYGLYPNPADGPPLHTGMVLSFL